MHRRVRQSLAVLTVGLVVAACGGSDPDTDVATAAVEGSERTSAAQDAGQDAGTASTVAEDPGTIIVAGDSIIYDVAPAVVAAIDPASATVIPLVTPSLAAESSRLALVDRIQATTPETVVVMVGVWERAHIAEGGLSVGQAGFAEAYATEALDPLLAAVSEVGARLVILGPPHLRDTEAERQINELEVVWQEYAAAHDGVDFIDTDSFIGDQRVYSELETDGSTTMRLRRIDGIHLCEEGARRIASGVVDALDDGRTAPLATVRGWETGTWTERFPVDECPPTS